MDSLITAVARALAAGARNRKFESISLQRRVINELFRRRWVWLPKIASGLAQIPRWAILAGMIDLLQLLAGWLVGLFRSHAAREAEMAFLRPRSSPSAG